MSEIKRWMRLGWRCRVGIIDIMVLIATRSERVRIVCRVTDSNSGRRMFGEGAEEDDVEGGGREEIIRQAADSVSAARAGLGFKLLSKQPMMRVDTSPLGSRAEASSPCPKSMMSPQGSLEADS
jgi:hypothetical protein